MRSRLADRFSRSHLLATMHRFLPGLAFVAVISGCAPAPMAPGEVAVAAPVFERRFIATVNFDLNSYRIRPESYALLDNAAIALNDPALGGLRFEVNGHTDIGGRLGYNISLSMVRASAVVDYLAARGVLRERMRPQGFGPLQLFDSDNPRSPANRRVEIVALR